MRAFRNTGPGAAVVLNVRVDIGLGFGFEHTDHPLFSPVPKPGCYVLSSRSLVQTEIGRNDIIHCFTITIEIFTMYVYDYHLLPDNTLENIVINDE